MSWTNWSHFSHKNWKLKISSFEVLLRNRICKIQGRNICHTKDIFVRPTIKNWFTWLQTNGDSNGTKCETTINKNRKNWKSRAIPKASWKSNLSSACSTRHNFCSWCSQLIHALTRRWTFWSSPTDSQISKRDIEERITVWESWPFVDWKPTLMLTGQVVERIKDPI